MLEDVYANSMMFKYLLW